MASSLPNSWPITIATNNGAIGGGEVMLLNIAEGLRSLEVPVSIVAPQGRGEMSQLADEARSREFEVVALPAESRIEWMRQLRAWDRRDRDGLLWCNGLVPATATAGHRRRIVHLHQRPRGSAQKAMFEIAKRRALKVVVPSEYMRSVIPDATVLANWCEDVVVERRAQKEPFVIGFLGRPSIDKGIEVLVDTIAELDARHPGKFRLALAGTAKFVDASAIDSVEIALARVAHLTDRLGWVGREELFEQINVLAVPSIFPESFGLAAAEAMAARVPVVVSDAGALPEVVGESGHVVVTSKPLALADRIEAILWSEELSSMSLEDQRDRWESLFSPDAGVARLEHLLSTLSA